MTRRTGVRAAVLVALALAVVGGAATGVGLGADPATERSNATPLAQSSVSVESLTVDSSTVAAGETVRVEARVVNDGEQASSYDATLSVDGEAVETKTVDSVEPGFPVIVPFEYTFEEAGTYTLSVGGASTEVTVEGSGGSEDGGSTDDGTDDSDNSNDGDGSNQGGQSGDSSGQTADPGQFEVRNVTASPATAAVGETVVVEAEIANQGEQAGDFEAELMVDGEVVATRVVESVRPTIPVPARFEYQFNESGTYTVSVSDVEADQQVTVGDSGGGGGPLGFLPMGILRPLLLFVGLPLLLVYLSLKALALYLGY